MCAVQVSKSNQTDRIDLSENAVLMPPARDELSASSRIVQERIDPHKDRSVHDHPGFDTRPSGN